MWPFRKKDPIKDFWTWFVKNEELLFTADLDAIVASDLGKRLESVHECLTWEVSAGSQSPREFIISADGIKEAFSSVEALADAAPPLPRWKIIRFRPRTPDYQKFSLEFGDIRIDQDSIEASVSNDGVLIGIELFVKGCPTEDSKDFTGAGFLMLDTCLGEYDVECKVGSIQVRPFGATTNGRRVRWAEFREEFDRAFDALHPNH